MGVGEVDPDIADMLADMSELALLLKQKKKAAGEVEFDLPESDFTIEYGRVTDVRRRKRFFSHEIIEQFMIAANEAVAELMTEAEIPFVYRVHTPPTAQKLQTLTEFLAATGYGSIPDAPKPNDIAALIDNAPAAVKGLVSRVALRSMAKATYETKNVGHFGLASMCYCHFTSPIRRYPDLAIHRVIKAYLKNGKTAAKSTPNFAPKPRQRVRSASVMPRLSNVRRTTCLKRII